MKQLIKTAVIAIHSSLKCNTRGKIIYYHDVYDKVQYTDMGTSLVLFKKHIAVIKSNGFKIVNRHPVNDFEIQLCFDDGWLGIWDTKDYFINNNILPTIFIAPNLVGKRGYLNWDQISFLKEKGFIFQSHTCNHVVLTDLNDSALAKELVSSKDIISSHLNIEIDSICFPCGNYSQKIIDESYKAGYKKLYISVPGSINPKDTIINRNLVQDSSPFRLKCILYGGLDVIKKRTYEHHFSK